MGFPYVSFKHCNRKGQDARTASYRGSIRKMESPLCILMHRIRGLFNPCWNGSGQLSGTLRHMLILHMPQFWRIELSLWLSLTFRTTQVLPNAFFHSELQEREASAKHSSSRFLCGVDDHLHVVTVNLIGSCSTLIAIRIYLANKTLAVAGTWEALYRYPWGWPGLNTISTKCQFNISNF